MASFARLSGVMAVPADTAVGFVLAVHRLPAQWAAWSARGNHFGDVLAQRSQLLAGRATGKRRGLAGFFLFRRAAFQGVDKQHVARAGLELAFVLTPRQAADLAIDAQMGWQ